VNAPKGSWLGIGGGGRKGKAQKNSRGRGVSGAESHHEKKNPDNEKTRKTCANQKTKKTKRHNPREKKIKEQ